MKYIFVTFLLISVFSFKNLTSRSLNAVFSYATFKDVKQGPYLETYLLVNGNTVHFVENDNGLYQAKIEITMVFKKNDSIHSFSKYEILSPEVSDQKATNFNFLDQQRFLLPDGTYDFELHIKDVNTEGQPFLAGDIIEVYYPRDSINISDIQLIDSFKETEDFNVLSKAGYDLVPNIINYYPGETDRLSFYAEIYDTKAVLGNESHFALFYYIEPWETQQQLNRYSRIRREASKDVNVLFAGFSIADLPSGNYNIVIEVRDSLNQVLSQRKAFFYRSNPGAELKIDDVTADEVSQSFVADMTDNEVLSEYINALYPISTEMERALAQNTVRKNEINQMQKYFYNFWYTRDMTNPRAAWEGYKEKLDEVNKVFSTRIRKGYETDRGRVYLQYGPPNTIAKSDFEPSAYPYEIWHYYNLGNQTNRRFVFLMREFATNNYELIHSDAIGEIYDPRWQIRVHQRDTPTHSLDPEDARRHWGGRVDDFYRNPR